MAAKDNPLNVKAELISPSGRLGMDQSFQLNGPSGSKGPSEWKSMLGAAEGNGTYTLRITQDSPGRITAYIYQGPFFLRIIGLPVAIAIFLLIIETASRRKPAT